MTRNAEDMRAVRQSVRRIVEGFCVSRSVMFAWRLCFSPPGIMLCALQSIYKFTLIFLIILNAVHTSHNVYFSNPSLVLILYYFSLGHSKHSSLVSFLLGEDCQIFQCWKPIIFNCFPLCWLWGHLCDFGTFPNKEVQI